VGGTTPAAGAFTSVSAVVSGAVSGTFNRTTSSGPTIAIQVVGGAVGDLGSDTGGNGWFAVNGTSKIALQTAGTQRAEITSTGLNSTAIGATTASTGSFTTLAATDDATVTTSSASIKGFYTNNATHGAVLGVNNAGLIRVGSTTNTNVSLVHNGDVKGLISSNGLAVTGALSSTTGANFATSSGDVGIGTSSPSGKLDVRGASYFGAPNTLIIGDDGGSLGAFFNETASVPMRFLTSGTERARIDSSGNVGIGVTPTQRLDIATASGDCIIRLGNGTSTARFAVDNDGPYIYALTAADNSLKVFTPAGGTAMLIDTSGNVGIGVTPTSKLHLLTNGTAFAVPAQTSIGSASANRVNAVGNEPGLILHSDLNGSGTQSGTATASLGLQIGFYTTNDLRSQIFWAGTPLTFTYASTPTATATERMRIDTSGNLLVGSSTTLGTSAPTTYSVLGRLRSFQGSASVANTAFVDVPLTMPRGLIAYFVMSDGNSGHQSAGFFRANDNGASSSYTLFGQSENSVAVTVPSAGNIRITNNTGGTVTLTYTFTMIVGQ